MAHKYGRRLVVRKARAECAVRISTNTVNETVKWTGQMIRKKFRINVKAKQIRTSQGRMKLQMQRLIDAQSNTAPETQPPSVVPVAPVNPFVQNHLQDPMMPEFVQQETGNAQHRIPFKTSDVDIEVYDDDERNKVDIESFDPYFVPPAHPNAIPPQASSEPNCDELDFSLTKLELIVEKLRQKTHAISSHLSATPTFSARAIGVHNTQILESAAIQNYAQNAPFQHDQVTGSYGTQCIDAPSLDQQLREDIERMLVKQLPRFLQQNDMLGTQIPPSDQNVITQGDSRVGTSTLPHPDDPVWYQVPDCADLHASLTLLYSQVENLNAEIDAIAHHLAATPNFSAQAVGDDQHSSISGVYGAQYINGRQFSQNDQNSKTNYENLFELQQRISLRGPPFMENANRHEQQALGIPPPDNSKVTQSDATDETEMMPYQAEDNRANTLSDTSDCASLSASLTFLYSYVEKLDKKIDAISQHLASTASSFSSQAVKAVDNDLRTESAFIRDYVEANPFPQNSNYLVLPNLSTGLNQQCMCGDSTRNVNQDPANSLASRSTSFDDPLPLQPLNPSESRELPKLSPTMPN